MVKKLIAVNWKMSLFWEEAVSLLESIKVPILTKDFVVCPPFVYISSLITLFPDLVFGAQDCSMYKAGAYTGEVSAAMLHDIGCKYVILGHSERRTQHNEDNAMISRKVVQAVEAKIKPIICIGESIDIRNDGTTIDYLIKQLQELNVNNHDSFIIAYEPIWAIGSNITPNTIEIEILFNYIKKFYPNLKLLYGGSVDTANAHEFLSIEKLDGLLVGRASLNNKKLNQILSI